MPCPERTSCGFEVETRKTPKNFLFMLAKACVRV